MTTRTRRHLYAQLGMTMSKTGDVTTSALAPVDDGIRTPGGIRAALLALLIEGGFGANFLDAGLFPVLDNMTVHVNDGGEGVTTAAATGELLHVGSRRGFATGRAFDADAPDRVLAHAHIGFAVIRPEGDYMPGGGVRLDDGPPAGGSTESILEAMDMEVPAGSGTCRLASVHDGVVAPEGRLHGGAHQLMHEAAALSAASTGLGTDQVRVSDFSIRFMSPALRGPFVATADLLSADAGEAVCQVLLVDSAEEGRVRSMSTMRIRRVPGG